MQGPVEFPLNIDSNLITEIKYYPNPTQDLLHITAGRTINKIVVNSILGIKLLEQNANATSVLVDFSNLNTGIYMINVIFEVGNETLIILKK